MLLTEEFKSDLTRTHTRYASNPPSSLFCPHANLMLLFFTMIINSQSVESTPNITIVVQSSATTHLHTSKITMMKLVLASLLVGPAVAFVAPPRRHERGVHLPPPSTPSPPRRPPHPRLPPSPSRMPPSPSTTCPERSPPWASSTPPPRIRRQGRTRRHAEALPREAER
jgi:hypothetical protein